MTTIPKSFQYLQTSIRIREERLSICMWCMEGGNENERPNTIFATLTEDNFAAPLPSEQAHNFGPVVLFLLKSNGFCRCWIYWANSLLATVKRWQFTWFGHVVHYDSLSKSILQDTLKGGQQHGWQRKCQMDIVKEWTSLPMPELLTMALHKKHTQKRLEEDLCWIIHHVPLTTQSVKELMGFGLWTSYFACTATMSMVYYTYKGEKKYFQSIFFGGWGWGKIWLWWWEDWTYLGGGAQTPISRIHLGWVFVACHSLRLFGRCLTQEFDHYLLCFRHLTLS